MIVHGETFFCRILIINIIFFSQFLMASSESNSCKDRYTVKQIHIIFEYKGNRFDDTVEDTLMRKVDGLGLGETRRSSRLEFGNNSDEISSAEKLFEHFFQFKINDVAKGSHGFLNYLVFEYINEVLNSPQSISPKAQLVNKLISALKKMKDLEMVVIDKNVQFSSGKPSANIVTVEEFNSLSLSRKETLSPDSINYELDGFIIHETLGKIIAFLSKVYVFNPQENTWVTK